MWWLRAQPSQPLASRFTVTIHWTTIEFAFTMKRQTRVAFFTVLRVAKQKSSSARRSRLRPPRALAAAAAEPLGRRS